MTNNDSTQNNHIFLSYRSSEADFALRLAASLKNAGVKLWMDRLDIQPGDDWIHALQRAVNECAAVIAILSPDYIHSRYCRRELARADRIDIADDERVLIYDRIYRLKQMLQAELARLDM